MATKSQAAAAARAYNAALQEINNINHSLSGDVSDADKWNKKLRTYFYSQFEKKPPAGTFININEEYALQAVAEPASGVVLLQRGKLGMPAANVTPDDAMRDAVEYADYYLASLEKVNTQRSDVELYEATADEQMAVIKEYVDDVKNDRIGWFVELDGQHWVTGVGNKLAVLSVDDSLKMSTGIA